MTYVKTADGKILEYREVLDNHIPNSIFNNKMHANTCEIIANNIGNLKGDKRRVFVNLLFMRSNVAKFLTAMQFLQENNFLQVKKVFLPHKLAKAFQDIIRFKVVSLQEAPPCLIDFPSNSRFAAKYVVHHLYRLFGRFYNPQRPKNNAIVRTFVEVTETLHKDRLTDSLCLFFPFSLKIERQWSFLKKCRRSGYQIGFWGVPYSFRDLIKIILDRSEKNIVNFEYNGHLRQGREFAKLKLKNYYTEDDYDASVFLIADILQENGCNVVNAAHGTGQFGPYIACSVFEALNRPQISYYSSFEHNCSIKFLMQDLQLQKQDLGNSLPRCFVFVHSNFKEFGINFSANLQTLIVNKLSNFVKDYKILIKYHPNGKIFENTNIEVVETWEEITEKYSPVFFTLNSTSFFTNYRRGPFVFLGDEIFTPFDRIDRDIEFYHYNELEQVIKNYSEDVYYKREFEKQFRLLDKIQKFVK